MSSHNKILSLAARFEQKLRKNAATDWGAVFGRLGMAKILLATVQAKYPQIMDKHIEIHVNAKFTFANRKQPPQSSADATVKKLQDGRYFFQGNDNTRLYNAAQTYASNPNVSAENISFEVTGDGIAPAIAQDLSNVLLVFAPGAQQVLNNLARGAYQAQLADTVEGGKDEAGASGYIVTPNKMLNKAIKIEDIDL